MIAYHFPPLAGSSGIQRTLRFVQHLPALGWQPLVLTASRQAYEQRWWAKAYRYQARASPIVATGHVG
jgi:hypothetical protein